MDNVKETIRKLRYNTNNSPISSEVDWNLINDAVDIRYLIIGIIYDTTNPFTEETQKLVKYNSEIDKALVDYFANRIKNICDEWKGGSFERKHRYCILTEALKKVLNGDNTSCLAKPVSKYESVERFSPRYAAWRSSVLLRDNFTCSKCGSNHDSLHAHHIESYANDPDKACDPKNGITFCKSCHRNFHSRYGNSAGRKELEEFLSFSTEASQ